MADEKIVTFQTAQGTRITAHEALAVKLGYRAEAEQERAELKGKALDEALKEAGLPLDGRADEKRARYAEYLASEEPADEPVDEPVDGSGDAE